MKKSRFMHNRTRPSLLRVNRRTLIIAGGVLAVLLVLVLLLRPSAQLLSSAEVAVIKNRGVLRVGILENAPGFSSDGEGIEIAIAERLVAQIFQDTAMPETCIEWVSVTERTARPKLANGEIDVALAKLYADGSSSYAYSGAYYTDPCILLVSKDHANDPLTDQTIGVIQGSIAQTRLKAYNKNQKCNLGEALYASYPDLLWALEQGEIDAIALPRSYAGAYLSDALVQHAQSIGSVSYVAASTVENQALALLADMAIEQMQNDGTLNALFTQYGLEPGTATR